MTVIVKQDNVSLRGKIAKTDGPSGVAGQNLLRANTVQNQMRLLGVAPKNKIINGRFMVNQRGTQTVTAPSGGGNDDVYGPDRFYVNTDGFSSLGYVVRRLNDGPANSPFHKCLEVYTTTSETTDSNHLFRLRTELEGLNLQDWRWGTDYAQPITLQFWVKTNCAGRYSISAYMQDGGGDIVNTTYNVGATSRWQRIVWVIPPNSFAAPADDNTDGIRFNWNLSAGSSYQGTSRDIWGSYTSGAAANGQQADLASSNTYYYRITGVALATGAWPDGFEFEERSYAEEEALCQRYYNKITLTNLGLGNAYAVNAWNYVQVFHPVEMRTTPSLNWSGGSGGTWHSSSSAYGISARNPNWSQVYAKANGAYTDVYVSGDIIINLDAEL